MKKTIAAALLLVCASNANAGTSAGYGMGGSFARFDPVVDQHNASGELFRIVGHCQSSCTLFLGIKNVCVNRNASLLFHAAHDRQRNISAQYTSHMLDAYNSKLRSYLTSNGYMKTLAFHTISGADIIGKFGYRECPK
jgi:hypothetical protein